MTLSRIFIWALAVLAGLAASSCAVLQLPTFGQLPQGARLAAVEASPNYRDGAFQNSVPNPPDLDGTPFAIRLVRGIWEPRDRPRPPGPIPQ